MLIAAFGMTFVSCGDDNDEPEDQTNSSSSVKTDYGTVQPTGIKTMSIFLSAKDGETALRLPGFAPIRIEGHYNVYTRVIDNIHFYAEGDMEFAGWKPGTSVPEKFSDTASFGWEYDYILIRTKAVGSDDYAYACISRVRYLEEATGEMKGSLMGCVIKYQSPVDPETFTGF